jgi:hypothetical protein
LIGALAMFALCQKQTFCAAAKISLFDHLVGEREWRGRDHEANRIGGRQIDDEIKFGWLLDRNGWQAVDLTMASAGSAASDEPDRMLTFAFIWVMSSRARRKQCPENNPCAMAQALWS